MMKSFKKIIFLAMCVSGFMSVNALADTSGAAQLDTTPPTAEGPMTTEQTPAIIAKTYNNTNNNPQGNATPPKTSVMSPTGGNAANAPMAPSGQSIPGSAAPNNAPVPASPTNPNANLPQ
jgi:hypothetical protein